MSTIGSRIKELRISRGMTQQELAEKVGYKSGKAMISLIEKDGTNINSPMLKPLADALGVTASYLLGNEDTGTTFARDYIYELLGKLNPEGQRMAQEYIEMLIKNEKYIKSNK